MKIDPKHDYKKPLYAAGLATLIGATAVFGTACGPQIAGGMTIAETEVQLEGEAQTVETEEVVLMGETTIDPKAPDEKNEVVCSVETESDEDGDVEAEEDTDTEETEAEE
ncbi:MAG: hypothetical protein K5881_02365 [Saccharofermentans sp.]|nr:hypothetical protein [Saccharofermentans sp.]